MRSRMMPPRTLTTNDLISALAADVAAIGPRWAERRIARGTAIGGGLALALLIAWLGLRPDLVEALHGTTFWMKSAYTASLAGFAIATMIALGRPDRRSSRADWLLLLPVALLAAVAGPEYLRAPPADRGTMWLGHSWRSCSASVVLLAMPILGGLIWAFRRLAPADPRRAGAAAGLAAGALAATVYGLACPETSAAFVLTWYSLGIVASGALGHMIGGRLLRW